MTEEQNKVGFEQQYLDIMRDILNDAEVAPDRTGTGRASLFGRDICIDLSDGTLPVVSTRKINFEHGIEELLWMIKGSTNVSELADIAKPIWKPWSIQQEHVEAFITKFAPELESEARNVLIKKQLERREGSIGPMYGRFWRWNPVYEESSYLPLESVLLEDIPSDKIELFTKCFEEERFMYQTSTIQNGGDPNDWNVQLEDYIKVKYIESGDQLGEIIRGLKRRPTSARHVMSAWIPQYLPFEGVLSPHENIMIGRGALSPCHLLSQFFVQKARDGGSDWISLRMYQRSCDLAIGVCTNLVFYATLLHLVAHCLGFRPKEFIWTGGDVHLYKNHLEQAAEQIKRSPLPPPRISINPDARDLFAIKREDIVVSDYQHHEHIRYKVSI